MEFSVIIFVYRKPGLSPAAFKEHYENSHIPLLKSTAGTDSPLSHKWHCIQRAERADNPASVLVGTQADFQHDAYTVLEFEDAAAFQRLMGIVGEEGAAKKIAENKKMFLDRPKMTAAVMGDIIVTTN
ncbi:hypothetical protein MMC25_006153 [Agyrium rufum]|nr:hypothetical protein [Agyrium rufum]